MRTLSRTIISIAAVAAVVLALAPAARAGEDSGISVYVPDTFETSETPDGIPVEKSTANGFVVSSDPSSPLHLMTQSCSATWLVPGGDDPRTGKGKCTSIDPEGDTMSLWWRGSEDGGTWGFDGGTGKWEGVSGGGTWSATVMWEDGRYANSWEAKWTGGPDDNGEEDDAGVPQPAQSPLDTGGD